MLDPAGAGANLASGGRARTDGPRPRGIGGKRWVVCALLFFATTINYMDRTVLSFLAPTLTEELGWSESAYGWISSAFTGGYALGLLMMGWVMDRLGTRRGTISCRRSISSTIPASFHTGTGTRSSLT